MKRHAILTWAIMAALGVVTGAFMGTVSPTNVQAGETVCLTKSRLNSWRAIDNSTLEMTDKQMNRYTVHMRDSCDNLTVANATLIYRFWGNLSCLDSSVRMNVAAPGRGALTCRVDRVEAAAAPQ